jgi:hypothetical protein
MLQSIIGIGQLNILFRNPYVFTSSGPHLWSKPCPDETTVTAINMRRWKWGITSLEVI